MANYVDVKVEIDEEALKHAVNFASGTQTLLQSEVARINGRANAIGSYVTPKWHDHATGETKGDTPAEYAGDTQLRSKGYIGIVYTANYAAQKDNHMYNTLLKAKG